MARNYDPNKDYSAAIEAAKQSGASQSEINRLQQERQNKINDKYGGKEPTMYGSNKTYSQMSGSGSSSDRTAISNALNIAQSKGGNSQYTGTNYHQDAIDAAQAGNWEAVYAALAARDDKTAATGQNYGRTSADILAELMELYAQPEVPEMPSFDGGSWGGVLNDLANQLVSMNYDDWTNSEQYQALVDRYGLQGRQSMQDMLGQISSRTGGLASSYATTAAQQQYNDYMATLEQAALDMYGVNRDDLMQNAQLVHTLSQDEYNRYLDSLDQYWNQMQFNSNQQKQDQAMAADKAETLAGFGDFSGYKALGYSDAEIALMQAAYQSQMAADAAQGKTGNPSPGGGGGYENSGVEKANIKLMQEALGVTADGLWGKESQNAAKAAGWSTNAAEAWAAFGGSDALPMTGGTPTSDYGTKYNTIWGQARRMFDNGSSTEEIMAYLDRWDESQLTDAGLDYIMSSLNLGGYRGG